MKLSYAVLLLVGLGGLVHCSGQPEVVLVVYREDASAPLPKDRLSEEARLSLGGEYRTCLSRDHVFVFSNETESLLVDFGDGRPALTVGSLPDKQDGEERSVRDRVFSRTDPLASLPVTTTSVNARPALGKRHIKLPYGIKQFTVTGAQSQEVLKINLVGMDCEDPWKKIGFELATNDDWQNYALGDFALYVIFQGSSEDAALASFVDKQIDEIVDEQIVHMQLGWQWYFLRIQASANVNVKTRQLAPPYPELEEDVLADLAETYRDDPMSLRREQLRLETELRVALQEFIDLFGFNTAQVLPDLHEQLSFWAEAPRTLPITADSGEQHIEGGYEAQVFNYDYRDAHSGNPNRLKVVVDTERLVPFSNFVSFGYLPISACEVTGSDAKGLRAESSGLMSFGSTKGSSQPVRTVSWRSAQAKKQIAQWKTGLGLLPGLEPDQGLGRRSSFLSKADSCGPYPFTDSGAANTSGYLKVLIDFLRDPKALNQ